MWVCAAWLPYSGELTGWIERRLKQLREMAAEENESSSDVNEQEEMSEDEAEDTQTHCELEMGW